MDLQEAKEVLNKNGYLMEDSEPIQMSRKNIRKWLTSKFGIEFKNMEIGTYVSCYVVCVPDTEKQPIMAVKYEKYKQPITNEAIFDAFIGEGDTTLKGGVNYEVTLEDITDLSKQEMAKYFNDLFDKNSYFWEVNRLS